MEPWYERRPHWAASKQSALDAVGCRRIGVEELASWDASGTIARSRILRQDFFSVSADHSSESPKLKWVRLFTGKVGAVIENFSLRVACRSGRSLRVCMMTRWVNKVLWLMESVCLLQNASESEFDSYSQANLGQPAGVISDIWVCCIITEFLWESVFLRRP